MKNELDPNLLLAVGVKYYANPALQEAGAVETAEMKEHTIEVLRWISDRRDRLWCTLIPDSKSRDPNAVFVTIGGKPIGHVCKDQAPEVRGMLKSAPGGALVTRIDSVCVKSSGLFTVRKPEVSFKYEPEKLGVDWSVWAVDSMLCLPDDIFTRFNALRAEIEYGVLPHLAQMDLEDIRWYFGMMADAVRYNQSREVVRKMRQYISILYADCREEVRQIAIDLNVLVTLKGSSGFIEELVDVWWTKLVADHVTQSSYALVKQQCLLTRNSMLSLLDMVEGFLQGMPKHLYDDVGDLRLFFSHLNYLAPPEDALKGVLSLLALRRLLCKDLGLSHEPFYGRRVEHVTDTRAIPTTLGKVMEFHETQCTEHQEKVTLQRLVDFLQRDYNNMRCKDIEEMIRESTPVPSVTIGNMYGSVSGEVTQNYGENTKLIE